jgi:hypothetical protein
MQNALTPQMIDCANALGLGYWTVRSRIMRKWSPLEACTTPARFRLPDGSRQHSVRYGRPRCLSEAYATIALGKLRREEVIDARAWLVEQGLLVAEVAKTLPVERSRLMPPQARKPRIVKAKPRSWPRKLVTREFHRPI